jgi:hypothetical protein
MPHVLASRPPGPDEPCGGRASLFAHELTHVSQNRLRGGGLGRPHSGSLEGHAEWVKFKVVDLLGYLAYDESHDIMLRAVSGSKSSFCPPFRRSPPTRPGSSPRVGSANGDPVRAFLPIAWLVERYEQ